MHRSAMVRSGIPAQRSPNGPEKTRCTIVSRKTAVISKPSSASVAAHQVQRKDSFKDKKFSRKADQSGQTERREEGDPHQSAEYRHRRDAGRRNHSGR